MRGGVFMVLVACGPTVALPSDTTGTVETSDSTSTSAPPMSTTFVSTTSSTTSTPDDTGVATFSSAESSSSTGEVGNTTELISESSGWGTCFSNDECESGMCYLHGLLGGICGECLGDADCEWGCTPPNPLADPPIGAVCNNGMVGEGCQTTAACVDGLQCAGLLEVPGVLDISTCSECLVDDDCADGRVCSPNLLLAEFGGQLECVDPGSKPDGETCNLATSGQECASTHCGVADIMGLVQIGVCSECSNVDTQNEGCDVGESCDDPMMDFDGSTQPGTCV